MAKEKRWHTSALNRETVNICGSFRPDGALSVVAGTTLGKGFSVAGSGTGGEYIITFDDVFPHLISARGCVREAAGAPTFVQFGDYDATAGTLYIRVMQESGGTHALTDLTDDVDNVVNFSVDFGMSRDATSI